MAMSYPVEIIGGQNFGEGVSRQNSNWQQN